ncbi:MAG: glycosyltransferase family 1 protein [Chloroflexi bacterium]|nr:glycosyltransferase family 1 protein [Chloroflexota bacterium]
MKVAMISYHTCPLATLGGKDTGGMNVYVRELTRHLGKIDIHVDVYTRSQDEHVPHVLHDLGYGNRVVHVPAGPEFPLPKQELASYLPEFVDGICRFAGEKGIHYDLIHSHYWMSGIAALSLRETWKAPFVHMFHTLGLMKNRVARSPSEVEGPYRADGERQVLRAANKIIVATPAEQSQLEFLYQADSRKLVTIPPGVDTTHFYPIPKDEAKAVIGVPTQDRMILYVGRIEPLKGVDILIRALAQIKANGVLDQYPHYLAIIGGDPDVSELEMNAEMARLKKLCAELGIGDLVVFLGKRSQDMLAYYYSAAEVLVMPSHYESFGMVALEAMACGTPVVASQVGGLAFLVQDGKTGFFVPDDDPEALADRLTRLIEQPELLNSLGQQANRYAHAYGWDQIAARVAGVYREVLSGVEMPNPVMRKTVV